MSGTKPTAGTGTALTRRAAMAGAAGLVAGCGAADRAYWAADAQPHDYPTVQAVRFFAQRVAERTDGRIRISVFPGAQLGAENDTIELTVFGGIAFNRINLAPLNAVAAETMIPSLPFLFRSTAHMRRAVDGAPGRAILDALEPHGLVGLCYYDAGERSFYNRRRDIHTPEDLRGLKIRVQNSDLYVALVEGLGGNATPIPYGEVYQALLQGVIDGAENNWPSYESSRHYEVARSYSLTRHVMAPEALLMSLRIWRDLSDDDQEVVMQSARESVPFMRSAWEARDAAARKHIMESGVTVIEDIDRPAFEALMEPVWARFVTTPAQQRLVDDIRAMADADA